MSDPKRETPAGNDGAAGGSFLDAGDNAPAARALRRLEEMAGAKDALRSPLGEAWQRAEHLAKIADPLGRMRELLDSPAAEALRRATNVAERFDALGLARSGLSSPAAEALQRVVGVSSRFDQLGLDAAHEAALGGLAARIAELRNFPTPEVASLIERISHISAHEQLASSGLARLMQMPQLVALAGRPTVWADQLLGHNEKWATLASAPTAEIDHLQRAALSLSALGPAFDQLGLASAAWYDPTIGLPFDATRFKLSALAGAADLLGFQARTSASAYEGLFGQWHTRPDLPPRFWRDPELRARRYREAEVDDGLIEATPAAAIDIVVGSGFVSGRQDIDASTALVQVGGLEMRIRSRNVRADTYALITTFEEQLRTFVASKMQEIAGTQWLKQRAGGDLLLKAKRNREAALSAARNESSLIAYLDLGDLLQIMTRNNNWNDVFGPIFPNRERFQFDMQALIAVRRPTMHARSLDAVRLTEMICVVRRLSSWIEGDGAWRLTAEQDF